MSDVAKIVTCLAPVNIAVIKYWGKRDEQLILPIHDSLSLTLDIEEMHAMTTVAASPDYESDRMWLNGIEESVTDNPRLSNCLAEIRRRSNAPDWKVRICSKNNFPTAAGLASSAAGYACLVYSLCRLFNVDGNVSALARLGSGSACRSVHGGFVRWYSGTNSDGSDSISETIFPAEHWNDIKVIVCVVNDSKKKVSSSLGMRNAVKTSSLIKYRADTIVPKRMDEIIDAISRKDFDKFAELTIKDSNQFHAICQDTYPPNVYMNETSHAISSLIHQINEKYGRAMACYTYDAGPNACIFLPSSNVDLLSGYIKHFFPPTSESNNNSNSFFTGKTLKPKIISEDDLEGINLDVKPGSLKYVIHSGIGTGPSESLSKNHLLDLKTGEPTTS